MKRMLFRFIPVLAIGILVGCGDDSRDAAKETARAASRLFVATAGDAVSTAVDVAKEGAKGTGDAIAEQASGVSDSFMQAIRDEAEEVNAAVVRKAGDAVDALRKGVK